LKKNSSPLYQIKCSIEPPRLGLIIAETKIPAPQADTRRLQRGPKAKQ
jgi:hypothetical protein